MNQKYIVAIDGGTQSTKVSIFDTVGNESLFPVRTIIGHYNHFVGIGFHLFFQNNQILASCGQNNNYPVACLVHCLYNGQKGRTTHSSAGTYNGSHLFDVGSLTKGTNQVGNVISFV